MNEGAASFLLNTEVGKSRSTKKKRAETLSSVKKKDSAQVQNRKGYIVNKKKNKWGIR